MSLLITMNTTLVQVLLAAAGLLGCGLTCWPVGANLAPDNAGPGLLRINLVRSGQGAADGCALFGAQFATKWTERDNDHDHDHDHDHPKAQEAPLDTQQLSRINTRRCDFLSYIGEVRIGTPARPFRLLLDSGSAELWVPSARCADVDRSLVNTFDESLSSSYLDQCTAVKFNYVNGATFSGRMGSERMLFGDDNNLVVTNQTFSLIDQMSNGSVLQAFRVDGILGLNFRSLAHGDDRATPMANLVRVVKRLSGGRAKPMISVILNHGRDSQRAGQLIVGAIDHRLYTGPITWAPMTHAAHWQFRMDSIQVELVERPSGKLISRELTLCQHGCQAVADTGTLLITGPPREVEAINANLGARFSGERSFFFADNITCALVRPHLPQVSFVISGRKFTLTPEMYTIQLRSQCQSAFTIMNPHLEDWILGSVLIGHYYTILDFERQQIGLAQSIHRINTNIINL